MTEQPVITKAQMLADIERSWNALHATLGRLTEAQLTIPQDAQGWSVKDHLVHLAFWERSAVSFLQGRPRHAGLGVEEALYLSGLFDEINAAICQQHKRLPLAEVLALFRSTHQQLLALLEPLTDADLQKPYRHYLPAEPGKGDGPPAWRVIYSNSAYHYDEHLPWMEKIVAES